MAIIGVDEAGKGPVLGPMVTAAVRAPNESILPSTIDDSKRLSPTIRTAIATTLQDTDAITLTSHHVTPSQIDDPTTDLNTLTVDAHATVINQIAAPGDRAIVDASDVNADRFADRISTRLTCSVDVTAEHRADETYSITGAASIVAKVNRDIQLNELTETHGTIGSGYPSDHTTRTFLENYYTEHGEFPSFARTSWQTCTDIKSMIDHPTLSDF